MIEDVVIDTNIFLHADNLQEPRQPHSEQLLRWLLESQTKVCVDEGYHVEQAKNRSHIGSEYLTHLRVGMLGYVVIQELASSARISVVSRSVSSQVGKKIRRAVQCSRDAVFVKVAFNSQDKILVSHDFGDITPMSRVALRRDIGVGVLSAEEAMKQDC